MSTGPPTRRRAGSGGTSSRRSSTATATPIEGGAGGALGARRPPGRSPRGPEDRRPWSTSASRGSPRMERERNHDRSTLASATPTMAIVTAADATLATTTAGGSKQRRRGPDRRRRRSRSGSILLRESRRERVPVSRPPAADHRGDGEVRAFEREQRAPPPLRRPTSRFAAARRPTTSANPRCGIRSAAPPRPPAGQLALRRGSGRPRARERRPRARRARGWGRRSIRQRRQRRGGD